MATILSPFATAPVDTGTNLSSAQTGTGDSTNILDRGNLGGSAVVVITSTVGATPTVTVNILGSMDGVTYYNVPYSLTATPGTITVAAITITTATTVPYFVTGLWRFLKLAYTANTNVTLTVNAWLSNSSPELAL